MKARMLKAAPKDTKQNAAYRRAILARANRDVEFQREVFIRCARDPVFYCDCFLYTYSPKEYPNCPNRPFVLWPYQEEAVKKMLAAVGKHDLLVEKSRDMGATWLTMLVCEWLAHFHRQQSILLLSRKEDLVDGNPDALMPKIDYMLERLPGWLQPTVDRKALEISYLETGSIINGESTNSNAGRGGRRTLIVPDEFPAVENDYEILRATRDATNSRFFVGTPQGARGAYYETRQKMEATNPDRILRIHWSQHPQKSRGLYSIEGCDDGMPPKIIDHAYKFPPGFDFRKVSYPQFTLRSPWFNEQCDRASSAQEIAQELGIDYAASGWQYFDPQLLDRLIKEICRRPTVVGELSYDGDGKNPSFLEQKGARLELWFTPTPDGKVPDAFDPVIGCDTATGKGGAMSSSSAAAVYDRRTGERLARFKTNLMSPSDFCKYVLGLCRWFNDAFLIWEENGPGGEFTKQVKESHYRNVFYREDETSFIRKKTRKPGWWSNKDTKRILLSDYAKALIGKTCLNRSVEALKECGEYIHEPNGDIVHGKARSTIDPTATGENHGDEVIADALAVRGMADVPVTEESEETEAPPDSFLARRLEHQRRQKEGESYFGRKGYFHRPYFNERVA